jgi:arylsulfatase A-like enzyme
MMHAPGIEPARYHQLVQPPDLLPTLLSFCGLKSPDGVEGRSLVPIMEGREDPNPPEIAISTWTMPTHFSEGLVYCRRPTVTDGEWTLVLQEPPEPRKPKLYRFKEDPRETKDVMAEHPEEARRLHAKMIEWLVGMGTPKDAVERLRSAELPV